MVASQKSRSSSLEQPPAITLAGETVHRHQLVTQDRGGFDQHYIVVGFTERGVLLDDTDFDGDVFEVDDEEWTERGYRPVYAGDVPVWAY